MNTSILKRNRSYFSILIIFIFLHLVTWLEVLFMNYIHFKYQPQFLLLPLLLYPVQPPIHHLSIYPFSFSVQKLECLSPWESIKPGTLRWRRTKFLRLQQGWSGNPAWRMDFHKLSQRSGTGPDPGAWSPTNRPSYTYHIYVEDLGCSYGISLAVGT